MVDPLHFRKLECMMLAAPLVAQFDCSVSVAEGRAGISFPVHRRHFHGAGGVHGAIYFFALDNAAMLAANSVVSDRVVFTTGFTIEIVRPVREGRIRAEGRVTGRQKDLIEVEATVFNDDGAEIGRGRGTFGRSQVQLGPETGYA